MFDMWLGIDVGTGSSRALLVDERGGVRAGYTALHEDMQMARPQWAEQRPENCGTPWWKRFAGTGQGRREAGREGHRALGAMHGLVILDEARDVFVLR
jgi:xylulokinase